MKIKEKVLKDLFPNKKFVFLKKDGVMYISNDAVDILLKHEKETTLAEVGKVIDDFESKFMTDLGYIIGNKISRKDYQKIIKNFKKLKKELSK